MSIKVMTEVWEHAPFVGTDLLILLALADMANDDRECWPGLKHVAHKGRITIQQTNAVLQNLELQGVIEIIHRTLPERGNISNLYRIKPFTNWDLLTEYERSNPTNAQHTPPTNAQHGSLLMDSTPPSNNATGKTGKEPSLESPLEPNTSRKREKGSKKDTIPALQMNPMKDAIVAAVGWNPDNMTRSEWGIVMATAKELCTAGFDPERVMSYYAWCKAKFPDCSVKILTTKLSEYRNARLDSDGKVPDYTNPAWADIPELRGVTEIIR